jgi:outer membrane protein OmpA-like peptidoglycan-associated protein
MKKVNLLRHAVLAAAALAAVARAATLDGLPGELFVPSARPLGHLGLMVSAGAYGHQDGSMVRDNLFLKRLNSGTVDSNEFQDLQSAELRFGIALGLGKHIDIGLSLPFAGDFLTDTEAKELAGAGPGDPLLSVKAGASLAGDHILDGAFLAGLSLPSKNGKAFLPKSFGYMPDDTLTAPPRFLSSYGFGWSARLLVSMDLARMEPTPIPFRGSLATGLTQSGLPGSKQRFLLGGDLDWVIMPYLSFLLGAQSETRLAQLKGLNSIGAEYAYAFAGVSSRGDDGIFFSVNLQKSLPANRPFRRYVVPVADGSYDFEAHYQPRWALAANIGWSGGFVAEDTDHDGIPDKEDTCPNEKEDFDGFQDQDGCPEPDNDQDGIMDAADKCPNEAEDKDGFQDEDGCPETDNDKDGIPDLQDKCPNDPEDMDGFEDYDGCPDLDNDKDGVLDAQDKCPNQAEDRDAFEDADGCPDPDNDQDKIPDINDKCPNNPETYNGFEDGDGCPDIGPGHSEPAPLEKRTLVRSAHFQGNTAQLLPESYPALDSLAARILAIPGVMVEVRGYWDGSAAELDAMRASEARAIAVRNYLVSKGIPVDQVLARGLGGRDPIEPNRTAAGRQRNRRIELHRLN